MRELTAILLLLLLLTCSAPVKYESIILEKVFIPEQRTQSQYLTSDTTSEIDDIIPEQYLIFIREQENVINILVEKENWVNLNRGDKIVYMKSWFGRKIIK